ncbi:MAG TPA: galactose-1-phosphate uridylyltransferase [Actinomycetota bacterium]
MSTLRQDPTTAEWVIIAPHRAARPRAAASVERPAGLPFDADCPFCPGNEERTPPEIARTERDGSWDQRVFANLYPALQGNGSTERQGNALFREMPGVGQHEVIVESPRHDERLDDMETERLARALGVWRDRYTALRERPWVKSVIVFRNFGARAGTSLPHPHSQILGTPVFAPDALRRYSVATRYFDDTGHCVYDDLREAELGARDRVVFENETFVALAPFASRNPYETWILPRRHRPSFGDVPDDELEGLAQALSRVLRALREGAGDPDYNLIVQSAPAHEKGKPFFLWHLQLFPRTTTPAGFELGSGMSINPMAPEQAAATLREAIAVRP